VVSGGFQERHSGKREMEKLIALVVPIAIGKMR
jgi:hypothetical protein